MLNRVYYQFLSALFPHMFDGMYTSCSVEDLIHEESFDTPILQVCIGKFVPSSPNMLGLAVLHPRKVTVYEFVPQGE